jgi:23S rRNA maturation-related 3'-5' exoribonuclease YhaM
MLNKEAATKAAENLRIFAEELGVEELAARLLTDERFLTWSGSSKPNQHHYGDYGLVIHTWEVVQTCRHNRLLYPQYNIDETELYLAALYHDAGKMYDYMEGSGAPWTSAPHKRYIHHISRSAIIWSEAVSKTHKAFQDKYADPVLHAILAHHGQRQWGSPVAPKSRVAWLLHLCDGISARLYDADTLDVTQRKDF